jgi:hypothetical protein
MIYTDPLFLGVTPSVARNYVADKVVLLEKPFFNACAGRFSVVEAAIKAGAHPWLSGSPRSNSTASIPPFASRSTAVSKLGASSRAAKVGFASFNISRIRRIFSGLSSTNKTLIGSDVMAFFLAGAS